MGYYPGAQLANELLLSESPERFCSHSSPDVSSGPE